MCLRLLINPRMNSHSCQLYWFPAVELHKQHLRLVCGAATPTHSLQVALMLPSFTDNTSTIKTEFLQDILIAFDISKKQYQIEQAHQNTCTSIVKKMNTVLKNMLEYIHVSHTEWDPQAIKYVKLYICCLC